MDEQTTTESVAQEVAGEVNGVAVDDQGMAIPNASQPETATEEAESHTEESDSSNDSGEVDNKTSNEETSQPEVDPDLTKWAQAKGLELNSESEIKMAKMARESEKAMHTAKSEAKSVFQEEAEKPTEGELDPVAARLASLEAKVAINDFYAANPEARQYDEQMGEALANDPELLNYVRSTGNIKAVYSIVKAGDAQKDAESFKKEGGREALTQLANKQQAAAVKGSAVNTAPSTSEEITPQNVDALIEKNGQQWYVANREKINKVLDPSYGQQNF